ncbi:MAG: Phytochrome-like protein cph2 [Frankiales bacterium]|nr:Phytochrome-like protein cph2 [Frankiales bacterium]
MRKLYGLMVVPSTTTSNVRPEDGRFVYVRSRSAADLVGMSSNLMDPANEADRQKSAARYFLTDTPDWAAADANLARLTAMAQRLLGADFSAIDIFDAPQQATVAGSLEVSTRERSMSVCRRLLTSASPGEEMAVADASRDSRLADSPFVNGELASIRFFAAAPLIGREGLVLGAVCVWSDHPATLTRQQRKQLATIRDAVMTVFDAHRQKQEAAESAETRTLAHTAPQRRARTSGAPATRGWSIDAVIDDRAIRTVFQPIVHLATASVTGFEALSRGPAGSPLESPADLIHAAQDAGRLGELDWLCRTHAMQAAAAAGLHPSVSWFINVEPAGLSIDCPRHLLPTLTQARTELRVVLEVVERDVEGYVTDLLRATDQARRDSWGVALDDVGAEEASLALLPFLRPDVVKLDMSLLRGAPSKAAAAITAAVRAYTERTGAVILAEGIETEEQENLARVFGATYGQGYRYGRPGPLPSSVPAPRHVIPLRQRLAPLAGDTPFEALSAALGDSSRTTKANLLHISRHIEEQNTRSGQASVLLSCFQHRRYFTEAHRQRYERLAQANALTVVLADGLETHGEPRFQIAPLDRASNLAHEWVVIVIGPHHAAAFVAKDCGDAGDDALRRFDYYYTHDRDAVIAAARAYLQELKPEPHLTAEPQPSHTQAASDALPPQRRARRWSLR